MRAGPPKEVYTRDEARRLLGIGERQLRRWESQRLVPRLQEYTWRDLIAVSSLKKLLATRVPAIRVRRAVEAIRSKLAGVENPLRDLKIVSDGRSVSVIVDGHRMEPVSGQFLLDFDTRTLADLLAFPGGRQPAVDSKREAEAWFERGLELEQTGALPGEIIATYKRAIELDPRSAGALVNLGTVHYHLKEWKEAERCYKQALEVDAAYALAYFNLGNLYEEIGRRNLAAAQYLAALRISPQYADAHYNFALLAQAQGDFMNAVRHWKAYLKLDGSSTWADIARAELEKLRSAVVLGGKAAVRSQKPEARNQEPEASGGV